MEDKRIWDKGTAFESGPEKKKPVEQHDDIIWDKGTPFEYREPRKD